MSDFHRIASLLAQWPRWPQQPQGMDTSLGCRIHGALRGMLDSERARTGALDVAGLISQLLRAEALRLDDPSLGLCVPRGEGWPDAALWSRCLCEVVITHANQYSLRPRGWHPQWLNAPGDGDPLTAALLEERRREVERLPTDPAILEVFGHRDYLGAGQRMAVRSSMLLAPGGALLVVLPTGGGKSLAMMASALLPGSTGGLTLVVVPTVALALDQARRTREFLANLPGMERVGAWAYHGGLDDDEKRELRQRVAAGAQPILFASPEAVMLSLRQPLLDAAQAGRLRAFIIDEAHLVAQWGTDFRPEFQALSGLRRTLLDACGEYPPFRTLLLTATLTEDAWVTLNTLFGDGMLEVCASVSMRPEPDFHLAEGNKAEREIRVTELAHVLPRPFILYTTRREDCEAWMSRLQASGLLRVGMMHGLTPVQTREQVLERWARRELDVMVATSAFGLGMDQSDVRAVIHACVPETVDRFYQEVGRGGRDGNACLSFLVHAPTDIRLAERLSADRVITVEKGLARWEAMYRSRESVGNSGSVLLRLDARPKAVQGDSDANVAWNMRTLVLMAQAGLLTLEAHTPPTLNRELDENEEAFTLRRRMAFEHYTMMARVRPASIDHLSKETWATLVQRHRKSIHSRDRDTIEQVRHLLSGQMSYASIFERTYRVPEAGIIVGTGTLSCPASRRQRRERRVGHAPDPRALRSPTGTLGRSLAQAVGSSSRVLVALPVVEPRSNEEQRLRRKLLRLMERLVADGLREISVSSEWLETADYRRLYLRTQPRIVLHTPPERAVGPHEESLPVPRLSLLWPTCDLLRLEVALELERPLHLIFMADDVQDLERRDRRFLDTRTHLTLSDFERRLD